MVPINSSYGIRCCADLALLGFVKAGKRCPNLWVTSRNVDGDCVRGVTFYDALSICGGFGARLCTVEENFDDCSRPAKCSLNDNKVWALD